MRCSSRLMLGIGALALAPLGCNTSSPQAGQPARSAPSATTAAPPAPARRAAGGDIKQRIGKSSSLLMESLQKPAAPFHFRYAAQENINPKYPSNKTAKPEVGPQTLEGDFAPETISFTTVRGTQSTVHKASKSDEASWAMLGLETIGPPTTVGLLLAFGQAVAQPAGSEDVGGAPADKFEFDTTTATGSTKVGLDIARGLITNIESTRGTVWIEKSSGRLVKFNIDAAFADKNNNAWKEHYEGEVTPK